MKKLFISLAITFLAGANLMAADYFWVGGSGNWNDASKWATSSNGPGGTGVPTATDNVFFDANSFTADSKTVTINTNAVCADMSWAGAGHHPILQRDATTTRTLSIYGSLTLIEQMDFNFQGIVYFESGFTGKTITSAGQSFKNHVYFQGEGGYVFQDDFTQINNFIVYFIRGSLNLNDKALNMNRFNSSNTNVRVLNFGSSTISISYGSGSTIDAFILNGTNLTFTSGTSLIRFTGGNFQFTATGALIFNNIISESATGTSRILSTSGTFKKIIINNTGILSNSNTVDTLTFNGIGTINSNNNNIGLLTANQNLTINGENGNYGHVSMNGNGNLNGNNNTYGTLVFAPGKLYTFRHGNTHIISDVLTANSNCAEPIILQSSSSGNQATIRKTSGAVTIDYCMLLDMKTDGSATFTANNSVDLGNNTGWTINAPAPLSFYWRGESGEWNDPANWRDQLGNTTDCVPSQFDNVFFDASSFSGAQKTVTITGDENSNIYCTNMDWTGVSGNHKITSGTGQKLHIHGSLTLVSGMDWDFRGDVYFKGEDTGKSVYSITSAGRPFKRHVYFQGSGAYKLEDDFEISGNNLYFENGGLDLNDKSLSVLRFLSNVTTNRDLSLGSSVITISYSGSPNGFEIDGTNLTFDAGASVLKFTGNTAYMRNFGVGLSFYDVVCEPVNGSARIFGTTSVPRSQFNKITMNNAGYLYNGIAIDSLYIAGAADIQSDNNNINVALIGGNAIIRGKNNFGKITLNGNAEFRDDNTIGTLIFTSGNSYTLYSGKTQTIDDDFFANGTEEEKIIINASSTSQAIINKPGGNNVLVEWVTLQYNKAVGGDEVTFTAENSLDLDFNEGWIINPPPGRELYWVGGTGNWNEAVNWDTLIAGPGGVGIPSRLDNVFFTEHSFSGTGQIVTVIGNATNNASCYNMDWTGVTGNHKIAALNTSQKLNIHGSLTLVSGMDWDLNGDVYFKGEDAGKSSYSITSSGQKYKRHVFFQGTGNYTLQDDFEISGSFNISFESGGLDLNYKKLSVHRFLSNVTTERALSFGSATITISYSGTANAFEIDGTNLTFDAGTSLLKFTGTNVYMRNFGTGLTFYDFVCEPGNGSARIYGTTSVPKIQFNKITMNNAGYLYNGIAIDSLYIAGIADIYNDNNINVAQIGGNAIIRGKNNFGKIALNGNGEFRDDNTIGTLIFTPGNSYTLYSGKTQTITNDFIANGTGESLIIINASGTTQATISKAIGNNVAVEWVRLQYNKTIGGPGITFTANNSFDDGNNEGWIINPPGGRDLYWVGGTGNWNESDNWAPESNGTGGAGIPTMLDNVFFDQFSFSGTGQTVTVIGDATNDAYCKNMDWTGVTGSPKIVALNTSQKLNIHGSLNLVSGMDWDLNGDVYFKGENTGKSSYGITSAGKPFKRHVYFQANGTYKLEDDLVISGNNLYLESGGLDLNDKNLSVLRFLSNVTTNRELSLGSSVVTVSYSGSPNAFEIDGTNLTFNAGTSLLTFTGTNVYIRNFGTGLTFYDFVCEPGNGSARIYGTTSVPKSQFNTINMNNAGYLYNGIAIDSLYIAGIADIYNDNNINLAQIGGNAIIRGKNNFGKIALNGNGEFREDNTIGTLIFTPGNSYTLYNGKIQDILTDLIAEGTCAEPMTIQSNSTTLQTTINKASGTVTVTRAFMQGLNATGGALFEAINSVDINNSNTGWDFIIVPENLFWVGGSGDWNDINKWSNQSGGAGGYCLPSRLDNVIFDASSFFQEAQYVNINAENAECRDMDFTGVQFVPTVIGALANNLKIFGSLTFSPAMNFNFLGNVYFEGQVIAKSAYNIFTGGQSFNNHIYFNGVGGEWNLMNDFIAGGNNIYLEHGTLNTNDNSVSCGRFISINSNTRALNLGASIFNLSSTSNEAWYVNSSNLTLDAGSSEVVLTAAGGGFRSYGTTILAYHDILFQNTGGTSILRSNHIFNNVVFNPVGTIRDGGTFGSVTMYRGGQLQNNSTYSGTVNFYGNTSITGTNSFARLLLGAGNEFTFPAGLTQTIAGRFITWGSAANPITIQSSASGTRATVSKSAGTVLGNYIQLNDMEATGGATFDLYSSIDNGNNIGWNFLAGTYDELAGITISNLDEECYEATEIITVGGTDHFTVQNGGSATLIAGYKIELLPGTRVFSGGNLHAYITPYGFFCDTISTMLASDLVEDIAEEPFPALIKKGFSFDIFPNPTTGSFTLELNECEEVSTISIEISSMVGERILRQEFPAATQYQVDLSRYQPGIYLVRVIQGNEAGVLKVVKK